jgi:glutaredoxin-like protein NrdH
MTERNIRPLSKWLDAGGLVCDNARMQKKTVKMYTLSTCSHCRAAKKLMSALGVQYDYVDVDLLTGSARTAVLEEVRKLNPLCSFPTILIGETVIVGNQEDKIREALGIE